MNRSVLMLIALSSAAWPSFVMAQTSIVGTGSDPRLVDYATYITEASARFNVPVNWIERVILAESNGRTHVNGRPIRSRVGAIGLMQLMPGTYRDMQLTYGLGGNPDDPRDNIMAGTAYLRRMFERFGYPGLFGAYNAGPERFADSLTGIPLPLETRLYLAKVKDTVREEPPVVGLFVTSDDGLFVTQHLPKIGDN